MRMNEQMSTFEHHEPRPGVLFLSGDLTIESAPAIKSVLLDGLRQHPKLEVDLLNVTTIDTAGVQLLVLLQREATRADKTLKWLGYSMVVEEVLDLLALSDVLGKPAAVVWS
jgi:anti-sigma B factor antagonist